MKITAIYTQDLGPINDGAISLINEWTEEVESKVLLTGPNGCGKSTLLLAVAMLWDAVGYWLDRRQPLPKNHRAKIWLQRWGGVAVVFDGIQPFTNEPVGLFFGSGVWTEDLKTNGPNICWIGEQIRHGSAVYQLNNVLEKEEPTLFRHGIASGPWFEKWSEFRHRMTLTYDKTNGPNLIFLDAETRRWVTPTIKVAEPQPDLLSQRWLTEYIVSNEWKGQLEASLITLKTTQPQRFNKVIKSLNDFLFDKKIESGIKPGEGRLRVNILGKRGVYHSMDELSAGERQVMILIYLISRWMQPGGIVLIDEPDLFLHPSLVEPLLTTLELLVEDNGGQLIITSHAVDVWERYENQGMRIELNKSRKEADK